MFVDTAAWIALANKDDSLHSQAIKVNASLTKGNYRLITTDFVFLEVADALSSTRLRAGTIAYINRLRRLATIDVVPVSDLLFAQGWQLYSQRADQE